MADETCIDIAVNGTLNVLRAASKEPSVKKVVLTSSCAAVNGPLPPCSFLFGIFKLQKKTDTLQVSNIYIRVLSETLTQTPCLLQML